MRFLIMSLVGLAVLASPCAYDTDPREPPVSSAIKTGDTAPKVPVVFSAPETGFISAFSGDVSWNS